MGESMTGLKRSHRCGEVDEKLIGQAVTVMGWVNKRRDLGKLIFIALRDRAGVVQVVVDGNKADTGLFAKAETIRGEYVVAVQGIVCARSEKDINPQMKTGKIEIEAQELRILSQAEVPPFSVADEGVKEDMRLKYRYLDLRKPELQYSLAIRHQAAQITRNFLSEEGFWEIETPVLANSSPEGARDYLVPSRIYPGSFYALPQSPQVFKQLLMVAGMDRYFQLARCFRDEDLRADRQPEFTQIDMEMSFVDMEDIIDINERLMQRIFKETIGVDVALPIRRMTYAEAMERFGSDKPDLRFGMELTNITELVKDTDFVVFKSAIESGGSIRGINAADCADMPRKQIDSLVEYVKEYRAKGLAWITLTAEGEIKTTLSKFFSDERIGEIIKAFGAKPGDLILICADKDEVVFDALGSLRQEIARRRGLCKEGDYQFVWITEFPLLEWVEEDGRYFAKHHPFTAPMDEDLALLDTDPGKVRAKAYDLALNGYELGGGSLRIYQPEIQEKMFAILGMSKEQAQANFGHLLEAFRYGAPPHGGLAFGLDRIAMLLTGASAIRDVIAFPKVKDASCPLTDAPGTVDPAQLTELGLVISSAVARNKQAES